MKTTIPKSWEKVIEEIKRLAKRSKVEAGGYICLLKSEFYIGRTFTGSEKQLKIVFKPEDFKFECPSGGIPVGFFHTHPDGYSSINVKDVLCWAYSGTPKGWIECVAGSLDNNVLCVRFTDDFVEKDREKLEKIREALRIAREYEEKFLNSIIGFRFVLSDEGGIEKLVVLDKEGKHVYKRRNNYFVEE